MAYRGARCEMAAKLKCNLIRTPFLRFVTLFSSLPLFPLVPLFFFFHLSSLSRIHVLCSWTKAVYVYLHSVPPSLSIPRLSNGISSLLYKCISQRLHITRSTTTKLSRCVRSEGLWFLISLFVTRHRNDATFTKAYY